MYGLVMNTEDTAKALKKFNRGYDGQRTWSKLYGDTGMAAEVGAQALENQYSKNILDAYKAHYNDTTGISNSALGEGRKSDLYDANEQILAEAFAANRQNYQQGMSELNQNFSERINNINQALNQQAAMNTKYADAHFNYLQSVFDEALVNGLENSPFVTDADWKKFLTITGPNDAELNMEAIKREMIDPITGQLTNKGVDFFDMMENKVASQGNTPFKSFGQYLSETDEELFDWANSADPYNFSKDGRNAGTFRELTGRESTDYLYNFMERAGGMDRTEVQGQIQQFRDRVANIVSSIDEAAADDTSESKAVKYRNITDSSIGVFNELKEFAREFGLYDTIGKEIGGWDNVENQLKDVKDMYPTYGKEWSNLVLDFFDSLRDPEHYDPESNRTNRAKKPGRAKAGADLVANIVNKLEQAMTSGVVSK